MILNSTSDFIHQVQQLGEWKSYESGRVKTPKKRIDYLMINKTPFEYSDIQSINDSLNPGGLKEKSVVYFFDVPSKFLVAYLAQNQENSTYIVDKEVVSTFNHDNAVLDIPHIGFVGRLSVVRNDLNVHLKTFVTDLCDVEREDGTTLKDEEIHCFVVLYANSFGLNSSEIYSSEKGAKKLQYCFLHKYYFTYAEKKHDILHEHGLEEILKKTAEQSTVEKITFEYDGNGKTKIFSYDREQILNIGIDFLTMFSFLRTDDTEPTFKQYGVDILLKKLGFDRTCPELKYYREQPGQYHTQFSEKDIAEDIRQIRENGVSDERLKKVLRDCFDNIPYIKGFTSSSVC
ncbi:MAG: hypothetical protein V1870_02885 [Candidatus Aenigmatarchaeota archaeon]